MSLLVLRPGLHSLLVDFGRPRSRSLGVSVGGAADRAALVLGNALVGNPADAVGLEIALAGPVLRATQPVACVVFGAPFVLTSSRQPLAANHTFTLQAEEELHIGGAARGARAYLCVAGGFAAPETLGSHSTFHPIKQGELLSCKSSTTSRRCLAVDFAEAGAPHLALRGWRRMVRTIPGPQIDWFSEVRGFFGALEYDLDPPGADYVVSPASNRMGLRLQGPPLSVPPRELVSEDVCPGTVQVTRDGQCIVLGVDAQTIGGYPKIAQVISADLDLLGQLRPGDAIAFGLVTLAEAEQWLRDKQKRLQALSVRLRLASGL